MDDLENVIEASLPSDGSAESSPADAAKAEIPAETPAKQVESAPVPFNEHPRWKEVQAEKERARQEADYWRQQAEQALGLAKGLQPQAPQVDPYAGMTPEEKAFWERNRQIAREEAEKVAQKHISEVDRKINITRAEQAGMIYDKFLAKYPDVVPGSPEEAQIANKFKQGYSLDDAYKVVFFEKNAQKATQKVAEQTKVKTTQKAAANLETSSVSTDSLPQKKKQTVREYLMEQLKGS